MCVWMVDRKGVYFEIPETVSQRLEKRIEELDTTKRDYFEEIILEDVDHIELGDPRSQLEEVERQLSEAQEELENIRDEEKQVRNRIRELEQEREELKDRLDEVALFTATNYDEAVDALMERAIEQDGIAETDNDVQRVAEEWGRDPREVCRAVYERCPVLTPRDVSLKRVVVDEVPDSWQKDWPSYDDCVSGLVDRMLSEGVIDGGNNVLQFVSNAYNEDYSVLVEDVLGGVSDGVDVRVVETDIMESPDVEDAPGADLVVDSWIADKIGLDY